MPTEIERTFRVRGVAWRDEATDRSEIRQGYLCTDVDRSVRVRLADGRATLTVKGRTEGARRAEFEYPIPVADARRILNSLCRRPLIEKTRHRVPRDDLVWEVDEFHGANDGLVVAEVELDDERQTVVRPDWLGDEVTDDPRYYNACLVDRPYVEWGEDEPPS